MTHAIFGDTTVVTTSPLTEDVPPQPYEFGSNVRITGAPPPTLGVDKFKPFYTPSGSGSDSRFFLRFQSVEGLPTKVLLPKDDVLGVRTLDVIHVSKQEEKAVKEGLVKTTAELRRMLVEEFAPFALSVDQAWDESTAALKMITPDDSLEIESGGIKQILTTALKILMVNKTTELLHMSAKDRALLIDLTLVRHPKHPVDATPT